MFNINSVINRTLIYFPVFKILINNIKFVENSNVKTACTTGNSIYYNSSFFQTLSKDEQVFIISHELMHITLQHIPRMKGRNIEIWNYVTDAVENQILKKNGLAIPEGLIDCPDASSYSAEEYYEIIKNRPDCEELMAKYCHAEEESTIATHEYWSQDLAEDLSKNLSEKLSDINEHNITEINKNMVHSENQEYKSNIQQKEPESINLGNVGNAAPVVNWEKFLSIKKKKIISADYNLQKGFFDEEGIYKYPYELIRKSNIEILIDTSGSVDDNLVMAFLQECKNIFDGYGIKVGCFDDAFHGFHEINKKEDLDNFIIEGRSGTDFSIAVDSFSKKAGVKIIFTDGQADMPKDSHDIIWVVYGNTLINPPGGKVFYVEPESLTLKGKSR